MSEVRPTSVDTGQRKKIRFHGCEKDHIFPWEHKTSRLETEEKQEARPVLGARDGIKCGECGIVLPDVQQYTIDHTRRWRDSEGHWLYDNHIEFLRLLCNPCNARVQHVRRGQAARPKETREKEFDGAAHTYATPEEIIRHDEGLPLVARKVIKLVKAGWADLTALQKAARDDIVLDGSEDIKRAAIRLRYGQIAGAISNETKISLQTVYSYMFGFKNAWNGWVRVANFPDGNLLTFRDLKDFDRTDEEIFFRVFGPRGPDRATGKEGSK